MSPATAAEFGPCIVETDVDEAIVATLITWLPTYLAQIERERSLPLGTLARPVPSSYVNVLDDDEEALDRMLPAIIVTTARTAVEPEKSGMASYIVPWRTMVSAVVRGRTPAESKALASLFSGSVRRVLLQHEGLGDIDTLLHEPFASEIDWVASTLQPIDSDPGSGRYLTMGSNEFVVFVDDVVQAGIGPRIPNDPYPDPDPGADPNTPYDPLSQVVAVLTTITGKSPGSP